MKTLPRRLYVVLSADGKMLDGKSKQGKHVTANR